MAEARKERLFRCFPQFLSGISQKEQIFYFDAFEALRRLPAESIYDADDIHFKFGTDKREQALADFVSREIKTLLHQNSEKI